MKEARRNADTVAVLTLTSTAAAGVLGIVRALRWLRTPVAAVALLGQPVGAALLAW